MKKAIIMIICCSYSVVSYSQVQHYQYDQSSRLINASYDSKKAINYSYDKDGNRNTRTNILCNNPVANFSASQISGSCPLTVDFSSSSTTQGTTTYEWTIYTDTTAIPSYYSTQNPTGVVFNYGGTFKVSLKVTDACGTDTKTVPGYITVNCSPAPTAIGSVHSPALTVFPNPVSDKVTIQGKGMQSGSYTIEVSDVWGRLLQTLHGEVQSGALSTTIPLTPYASGTYFLKVSVGSTVKSFKLTKE